MRTLFSVLFCLFVAAPLVKPQGHRIRRRVILMAIRRAAQTHSSTTPTGSANTAFGFSALLPPTPRATTTRPSAPCAPLQHHGAANTASGVDALYSNTTGCLQHGQRRHCALTPTPRATTTRPAAALGALLQHHGHLQHGQRRRRRSSPTPRAPTTRPAAPMRSLQHHGQLQHGQRRPCAALQHHGLRQHRQRHAALYANTTGIVQHGSRLPSASCQHRATTIPLWAGAQGPY